MSVLKFSFKLTTWLYSNHYLTENSFLTRYYGGGAREARELLVQRAPPLDQLQAESDARLLPPDDGRLVPLEHPAQVPRPGLLECVVQLDEVAHGVIVVVHEEQPGEKGIH